MKKTFTDMSDNNRMGIKIQAHSTKCASFHFERPRLNNLFTEAVRYPLVLVCAGAGYGKTSAVHDFTQRYDTGEYPTDTAWIQLSERDNIGGRFWENYINTISLSSRPIAEEIGKFGFPDNLDKLNQYLALIRSKAEVKQRILVMDDFHLIENPSVIRFVEHTFLNMSPVNSMILISRSTPRINTASLVSRGQIFNIGEDDLCFTENELSQYFRTLGIPLQPDNLHEIMQDTEGWAFAINLIARSYRKAPGYGGYLRNAMKSNIFRLMETEVWVGLSERLQLFLIRLSLIGHLSVDLIALLAGNDKDLVDELERENAYVSRDSYINAYLIHPLFLEFLATKQDLLSEEQRRETYTIAGQWCDTHGFKIDALSYYEKIGDYQSIVNIFIGSQPQIPYDIAGFTAAIFERAPPEVFDTVLFLATTHMRTIMSLGLWKEAIKLAEYYEARYINLPVDNQFRKLTLSGLYYCWGVSRAAMCLTDDVYDFDIYFEKLAKCFSEPFNPGRLISRNLEGPWVLSLGSSRKGAPEEYLAVLMRTKKHLTKCYTGFESGIDELAWAELMFYKNNICEAETYIVRALDIARKVEQYGIIHRALFYILRISVLKGDYPRIEQTFKDMKVNLDKPEYHARFVDYDISLCWYYHILGLPEMTPDWLKETFAPYAFAGFAENYANLVKAYNCYATRNYPPLLAYIQEMKQRESFLFGRVEMLTLEACVHYKMKNKKKALAILIEAYQTASPNDIVMPFIELGRDMRTLTAFVLKEPGLDEPCSIPKPWLESINRKSASYAKRLAHVVAKYKQTTGMTDGLAISPRESDILSDLAHGLSRAEIAASRDLSVNTVKMVINNLYAKMNAENLPDLIRIATERKMI